MKPTRKPAWQALSRPLVDLNGLYEAIDDWRRGHDLSWRDVAAETGIAASTYTRMKQGRYPCVEAFARMVRWLGASADEFIAW